MGLNSYTKLKAKNQELIQDIHALIMKPNDIKTLEIIFKWKFIFEQENLIWNDEAHKAWMLRAKG